MSQAFVDRLPVEAEGAIVNIASIRGLERHGRIGAAAYSAAKAGVISLTGSLAAALAPRITVNAVSPGFVETEYLDRVDDEQKRRRLTGVPAGRFIAPEEIAEFVLMLVKERAATGSNYVVDGGYTLGAP